GLAHNGVRSVVLEKKEALSPNSRAPAVLPRTQELLRSWGVLGRFRDEGVFLPRVNIWLVGESSPAATLDLSSLSRVTSAPGMLVLSQDRTEALLLDEVVRRGLTRV